MTTYNPSSNCLPVSDEGVKDVEEIGQAPAKHSACRDRVRKRSSSRRRLRDPGPKIRRDVPQHSSRAMSAATGMLTITSPVVRQRLRSEGVPENAVNVVATELGLCIKLAATARGNGVGFIVVSDWTAEIVLRYAGKLPSLFMKTRGRGTPR